MNATDTIVFTNALALFIAGAGVMAIIETRDRGLFKGWTKAGLLGWVLAWGLPPLIRLWLAVVL